MAEPARTGSAKPRRRNDRPGIAERRLAVEVVGHVLKARVALDETLDAALAGADLDGRDAGLARAIATATFRHLGSIRAALDVLLESGLPAKGGPLEAILLTGATQILDLGVPDHAAVDLAVTLTREDNRSAPYGKLVNAVLRRVARERDAILAARDPLAQDTPDWLAARWIAQYGAETARAIAQANAQEAALDITPKADAAAWAERLGGRLLPTGSIRLAERTAVPDLPGYGDGAWWVQDAAAAIPARLIRAEPGARVADLCAAPGGKTAQLAAAGYAVLAVDRSASRLTRLAANLARLDLVAETRVADATTLEAEPFDAVLLDAPCSATGTLRRHPDVAWTKDGRDIAKLAALQARLLTHAADLTRQGGSLVYCTCSLEAQEGEEIVAAFLASRPDFAHDPILATEVPGLDQAITGLGELRILPSYWPAPEPRMGGLDGFYAARLRRTR